MEVIMKKSIEEFKKEFGTVDYKGVTYILTQQAYIDNDGTDGKVIYYAAAITEDMADNDGMFDDGYDGDEMYKVCWDCIDNECEDESDACDWDVVAGVTNKYGKAI